MALPKISNDEVLEKFNQRMKKIKEQDLESYVQEKARMMKLPYIDLLNFPISPEAISLISEEEAKMFGVICFFFNGEEFRLGISEEINKERAENILNNLQAKFHSKGLIYLISKNSYIRALNVYKSFPKIRKIERGVKITDSDIEKFKGQINNFIQLQSRIDSISLTDLMTLIIASALEVRASDIHIEAEENDVKLRFRIDGILNDVASIKKQDWPKIISRVKLIAKLKLNIEDKPQDGRFTIYSKKNSIDVRVSTLPTVYGESVVMRLLSSSVEGLRFENLGLRQKAFNDLKKEIAKPNGMIISTGPTGSGKTTTLYAILNKLNSPDVKIITLEDPVEYKLSGINQSQVEQIKGYTFAKGLRSILRQDPDVVMVGEIRDDETADIAINAALTGHLVISTIHTNSAAGAVPRFLALNAKPYLLAPALNAIIGQRLVRRICLNCKKEYVMNEAEKEEVKKILSEIPFNSEEKVPQIDEFKFYYGSGCSECQNIGYKGRVGIYEVMIAREEIKKSILEAKNISEYDIQKMGQKDGMLTMRQDGLLKAIEGITTLEEVLRATK